MRIILSPTKKMKIDNDSLVHQGLPVFLEQTEEILQWLKEKSTTELKVIWNCNDKIIEQNRQRLLHMKLRENLTPAVLAYEGIAFQYMAPGVFENEQFDYIQEHLRILSAFYGVLKPMDGVTPYRLEMQAKASIGGNRNLYELWGSRLYEEVCDGGVIINLASKEYSRAVLKYLPDTIPCVTCVFGELVDGKVKEKGTYAKMARGEMVRFMAEHEVDCVEQIKAFDRLGYIFAEEWSDCEHYVFLRQG